MKAHIDRTEIEYDEYGQGPTVLFIHDYASNRDLLGSPFSTLVDAGYRVVLSNLRDKEGTGQRNLALETDTAAGLLNYLGVGRAVVCAIGTGGYVLYDLMERHPDRVAGFSFIVTTAMVAEIRSRADRKAIRTALREGRLDVIRRCFFDTFPAHSAPTPGGSELSQLRTLISHLCQVAAATREQGCAALLATLALPPLLIEGEKRRSAKGSLLQASRQIGAATRQVANGGLRRLKGLNDQLLGLRELLLPSDEQTEEDDIVSHPV
jgi:pimeloyl-ACP methyl ester carboxylesterase